MVVPFPVGLFKTTSSAWTPLSLGAKLLAWYDPDDISTLFQTETTGTPVTTNGQSVGRINDKSGYGNHLVQATAGRRPVYNTTGFGAGSPSIDFDGSDDFLGNDAITLGTTDRIVAATVLNSAANAASYYIVSFYDRNLDSGGTDDNTANAAAIHWHILNGIQARRNSTHLSAFAGPSTSTRYEVISEFNGTNHIMTVDGAAQSGVASTGNLGSPSEVAWGAGVAGGSKAQNAWPGKGGPLVLTYGTNLTAGEKTSLDAYLAAY
jgi:hypothetical protein